jgi:hypothetical protein
MSRISHRFRHRTRSTRPARALPGHVLGSSVPTRSCVDELSIIADRLDHPDADVRHR